MDRDKLLASLTSLDFLAVDLALYLNTHPKDSEAIREYNRVVKAGDIVRTQYEDKFGPLCSFRSYAQDESQWQWIDNPWPWQEKANFDIEKVGCR